MVYICTMYSLFSFFSTAVFLYLHKYRILRCNTTGKNILLLHTRLTQMGLWYWILLMLGRCIDKMTTMISFSIQTGFDFLFTIRICFALLSSQKFCTLKCSKIKFSYLSFDNILILLLENKKKNQIMTLCTRYDDW